MKETHEKAAESPASGSTIHSRQAEKGAGQGLRETESAHRVSREREWLIATARERGGDILSSKMGNLASAAEEVAGALHDSARKISAQNSPVISHYCDLMAGELTTVATALRKWDLDTMIASSRRFAGEHPGFYLGGAMAAGFLFARILKSSSGHERSEHLE
jgi:hypothetical protein